MITKTIPTVHKFFPFLFTAFCVIAVVISPFKAFADTTYAIYTPQEGGGVADTVQPVDGIDLDSGGNSGTHSLMVFNYDSASTTDIHGGGVWYEQYDHGGGFSHVHNFSTSVSINAELAGTGLQTDYGSPAAPGDYVAYWYAGNTGGGRSYCFFTWDGTAGDFTHCGTPPVIPDACDTGDTRICGFTPENNAVLTGPDVPFTLDAWLAAQDLEVGDRIVIRLHNIDQNVLLLGSLSPNDKLLLDRKFVPGEDGHYSFSTTTPLADGNYRVEAWIEKTIFFGFIKNPFDNSRDQVISKQFIVGTSTFIGNLSQNGFNILSGTLGSNSATSSVALVAQCNPLGNFNMVNCLAGLFIPDSGQVSATIQGMRDGILTRLPWGYFTRFAVILTSTATTTLPSFTAEVAQNTASDTTTLSFDPGDMLAGGGALVDSIRDPYNGKNIRDIFQPIVQLTVALLVLFEIASDLTGSHKHVGASSPGDTASKRKRV